MNLTDELEALSKPPPRRSLSDESSAQAKSKLLNQPAEIEPAGKERQIAGRRRQPILCRFRLVMGVIGVIILLIILFGVCPSPTCTTAIRFRSSSPDDERDLNNITSPKRAGQG